MKTSANIPEMMTAVSGQLRFGSDFPPRRDALAVKVVRAPFARASIDACDTKAALAVPGVRAVLTAKDLEGRSPMIVGSEEMGGLELIASREVQHYGQPVALVVAESIDAARAGGAAVNVSYQPLPPVLEISEALEMRCLHGEAEDIVRGELIETMASAEHRLGGSFEAQSQDPQWPEAPSANAEPDGLGGLKIFTGTRRPLKLQEKLASILGVPMSSVRVEVPPNDASQETSVPAGLAALAAWETGTAVSVEYDADESRVLRGHRPAVRVDFEAGYTYEGRILALDICLSLDVGCSVDPANGFVTSVMHHIDNAYWLPNVRLKMQLLRTNRPPRTANDGGATGQALFAIEEVMSRVARQLGVMPEVVRQRNFFHVSGKAMTTLAGLNVDAGQTLIPLWKKILTSSQFAERRKTIDAWNAKNQFAKRGLAAVPVKMGLGDPAAEAVQSSALMHILPDGSVQIFSDVNGKGQIQQLRECAAEELGLLTKNVRILPAATDQAVTVRVSDNAFPQLAVQAVRHACQRLRERLLPVATLVFHENGAPNIGAGDIVFQAGRVVSRANPNLGFSFENFIRYATSRHVDLSACGSAFIEEIARPYHGFLFGAAVSEVQVDSFTGEVQVLRSDLAHEICGTNPVGIGSGRLRAAFLEGLGWLVTEINAVSDEGRPLARLSHAQTHASLSPTIADAPLDFRINVVETTDRPGDPWTGGYGLALSVREALKDAIGAFGNGKSSALIELPVPAAPEAVFRQIHQQRTASAKVD